MVGVFARYKVLKYVKITLLTYLTAINGKNKVIVQIPSEICQFKEKNVSLQV